MFNLPFNKAKLKKKNKSNKKKGYPVNSPTDQLADANSPTYKIE